MRYRFTTLLVTIGTLVLTLVLYVIVPKGFFPIEDTGIILGISEAPQTVSFESMAQRQQKLADVILQDPDVQSLSSFIGIDGTNTTINSGRIQINLKPLAQRSDRVPEIIQRLQSKLKSVEGITLYMQPLQDLTVADAVSRTQYQYSLESADANELTTWTNKLVDELRKHPQLTDVASDMQNKGLETDLVVDRDTASRLGVQMSTIDNVLYDAFGQRQVSTMYTQLNQYHVILEVQPNFQLDPSSLSSLYVASSTGTEVPLSTFVKVQRTTTPLSIDHLGQFPASTISFNLAPGASLGDAVKIINQVESDLHMPETVNASFQGTAKAFEASLTNEPILILAALITVYIVLGVLYESYIHPVTILSTLPSAGVGAILALLLFGMDLNVIGIIGIILLIGIVKKNAIMMIDFALEAERARRQELRGGHLRGLPAALPAHHDDHHGRAARRSAARARHRHGIGAAQAARHHHRRRPYRLPGAHPLHHAGGLPLLRPLCAAAQPAARAPLRAPDHRAHGLCGLRRPTAHAYLRSLHSPPGRHLAVEPGAAAGRRRGLCTASGLVIAGGGVSHHQRAGAVARRQPGNSRLRHRDATGASVRPHRRRHTDDLVEHARRQQYHAAVRSQSQYRWRRARRAGSHQRGARAASRESAAEPTFLQIQPGGRADHDPGAHLRPVEPAGDLRCRRLCPAAEDLAGAGRGQSFVGGGASPAVRVEANPMQLSSYGIGLESLRTTLGAVNQNLATGYFRNDVRISNINTNDQLFQARNYAPLVVGYNPTTGAAVRLEDLASVIDSTSNLYTSGLANGKPAVLIIIFKIAGANVIDTVDRVKAALPSLEASVSPSSTPVS